MSVDAPRFHHNPLEHASNTLKAIPAWAGRHWKTTLMALTALGISAGFAINHYINSQGKETTKASDPFKPADPESNDLGVVIVPATSTAEASSPPPPETPTPTASPATSPTEVAKEQSCVIIPEQLCTTGELLITKNAEGKTLYQIGANISKDTPLVAPRLTSGSENKQLQLIKQKHGQSSILQGFGLTVLDPDNPALSVSYHGDIDIGEFRTQNIKGGDNIGKMQDTGVTNWGYNLVITASSKEVLERLYPDIMKQTPRQVEFLANTKQSSTSNKGQATPRYANVPPPH